MIAYAKDRHVANVAESPELVIVTEQVSRSSDTRPQFGGQANWAESTRSKGSNYSWLGHKENVEAAMARLSQARILARYQVMCP